MLDSQRMGDREGLGVLRPADTTFSLLRDDEIGVVMETCDIIAQQ